MGGFCSGPTPSQQQDIATGKFSGSQAPKNSALDDLQMDLGMKPKNQAYFRDLEDRQRRSQEAMKNIGKDIFGRPASDRSTPVATPEPEPEVTAAADIPEMPMPPEMTTGEVQAPTKDKDVGIGTAASGEAEAAEIIAEAGGEAEEKVADAATKGRRSTVRTTPQGLLAQAPTRKRRSLMGQMIA
tara:strand:+ start:1618 stop:2172 length:555 start_codon:yes stop_codon:yes gene_type:complete